MKKIFIFFLICITACAPTPTEQISEVENNIETLEVATVAPETKPAITETVEVSQTSEALPVEKYKMGVDDEAFLQMREEQILEKWGYETWEELVNEKVMNNPSFPYNGELANVTPVTWSYGDNKEIVLPYWYGFNQVFGAGEGWEDATQDAYWAKFGVEKVHILYVAAPGVDEPVRVPLAVEMDDGSRIAIAPWLYTGNDGGDLSKVELAGNDAQIDNLVGKVFILRFPRTLSEGPVKSDGYMTRLADYVGTPRFAVSAETQVLDRTEEDRAFFESLIVDEFGPVYMTQVSAVENADEIRKQAVNDIELAIARQLFLLELVQGPSYIIADMIIIGDSARPYIDSSK